MTDGRRWLALDADLFGKRFTDDLYREFGWAGIATWIAFLCACKQGRDQGRVRVMNDVQALHVLGLAGWDLVNNDGQPWTLTDFWTFTGRKKQTRRIPVGRSGTRRPAPGQRSDADRTASGQCFDVVPTHWQRWQDSGRRATEAEQKRTSRAKKRPDNVRTMSGHESDSVRSYIDIDIDTPLPPKGGVRRRFASNGKSNGETPTAKPIPEWQPEPEPESVIDKDAVGSLRANPSGKP